MNWFDYIGLLIAALGVIAAFMLIRKGRKKKNSIQTQLNLKPFQASPSLGHIHPVFSASGAPTTKVGSSIHPIETQPERSYDPFAYNAYLLSGSGALTSVDPTPSSEQQSFGGFSGGDSGGAGASDSWSDPSSSSSSDSSSSSCDSGSSSDCGGSSGGDS